MSEQPDAPFLFLSHAGADTEAARKLKQRLEAAPAARERSLKVWFDKDDLRAGESWQVQLEKVVARQATAFAVYVGSKGVVNWVEAEVRLALSRATSSNDHFPFIPILATGADGSDALPGFARQFQAVRDVQSKPEEFQKLVAAVLGNGEAGSLELEAEPFFGLKAIDETRSHLFFGRDRETQELVERLAATRLLMVTGDSGSGKSSLVRAGLVPRWRGGGGAS
jgi:TIR domain